MEIVLRSYLYYLKFLIKTFVLDSDKQRLFLKIVQDLNEHRGRNLQLLLKSIHPLEYQALMFPVKTLDDVQVAIVYYLVLQIFNHRVHSSIQPLTNTLLSDEDFAKRFLNAPSTLIESLKTFYLKADKEQRQAMFNLLQPMYQYWNCHFLRDLEIMFWVWRNQAPYKELAAIKPSWPPFQAMKHVCSLQPPQEMDFYHIYHYRKQARLFFAYKTWTGKEVFNQLDEDFDKNESSNPYYWLDIRHEKPPFPYITKEQKVFISALSDFLFKKTEIVPFAADALQQNLQIWARCFYESNYLRQAFDHVLEELHQDLMRIATLTQREKLKLLPAFSFGHESLQSMLAQLNSNLTLLEQKKTVVPSLLQHQMTQEIVQFTAILQANAASYARLQAQMHKDFAQIADFSFIINYQSKASSKILKLAAWSLGLSFTATIGLIVFAACASLSLIWSLSLFGLLAVGMVLGLQAIYLGWQHQGKDLATKSFALLPCWNGAGPK